MPTMYLNKAADMKIVASTTQSEEHREAMHKGEDHYLKHRRAAVLHMRAGMLHEEAEKRLEKGNKELSENHHFLALHHKSMRDYHSELMDPKLNLDARSLNAGRKDAEALANVLGSKHLSTMAFTETRNAHGASEQAFQTAKGKKK